MIIKPRLPSDDVHQLILDCAQLSLAFKVERQRQHQACFNCKYGRKPTAELLDLPELPAEASKRLMCLRSLEQDPVVGSFVNGKFDGIVLVHPSYLCLAYEART
jgi:hypothetical protein